MSKTCFVIAPIGEEGSEIRERSDQIYNYIITPPLKECGYDSIVRGDMLSEPGMITSQVVQHIMNDDLVVADLTGRNPNVYYELAIRHATHKPFIQIIQAGENIPFDIAGMRMIQVDHHNLHSVEQCKNKIKEQARAIEKNPKKIDSPISVAVNLQALREDGNPLEFASHDIVSRLESVQYTLSELLNHKLDAQLSESFKKLGDKLLYRYQKGRYVDIKNILEYWTSLAETISGLIDFCELIKDNTEIYERLEPCLVSLCSAFVAINNEIQLNDTYVQKINYYDLKNIPF